MRRGGKRAGLTVRMAAGAVIAALVATAPARAQEQPCVNTMADLQDAMAFKGQYDNDKGSLELLNLAQAGWLTAAGLDDLIRRKRDLKADVNKDLYGSTAIETIFNSCLSASAGPCGIDVLERLITLGADVNKVGITGVRPIDQLVYTDGFTFGHAALDQYQTEQTLAGYCLARQTGRAERLERLRWLIDQGARSGNVNPLGQPVMMDAAKLGPDYMAEMQRAGASVGNSAALLREEIDRLKASMAVIEAAAGS